MTGRATAIRVVLAVYAATVVIGAATAQAAFGSAVSASPRFHSRGASLLTAAAEKPIVVAHRGASGHRPEHTLVAYRLAIQMGADAIEPDLVPTKDGALVARHENEISGTTDVARHAEFTTRKTTKIIDGKSVTGWFAEDFTLAELKTLRAKERLPGTRPDNSRFDGEFLIPTLREILDLARTESRRTGREIETHLEIKHSTYFRSIGLPVEGTLVQTLRDNGLDSAGAPISIQAFETSSLRALNHVTGVQLVQIVKDRGAPYDFTENCDPRSYQDLATPQGLRWIASYADGVSLHKNLIVLRGPSGGLLKPTRLVRAAHAQGLVAYAWTFRDENKHLPSKLRKGSDPAARGNAEAEYDIFFNQRVDGLFSDFPDTAVTARDAKS